MHRKVIFFSLSILLLLVFSNLRSGSFHASKNGLDPRRIDSSELMAIPPVEDQIRFFQGRIKANPQDAVSFHLLAGQYVRQARETGDVAGYQRAEAALDKALHLAPDYGLARASLASVYYAQHDFIRALELAQQVYAKDPKVNDALATIGDAHLALGNYHEAEAAYRELLERRETPPVLARLAALEELKGDPEEALGLMQRSAQQALQAGGTQESVAWYVLRVGDVYFNMGQYKQAGNFYQAALDVFDRYHLALAGLGKVRAAQGKYEAAIDYYQRASNIVPQPEYLAALGDLYTLTDRPEQAQVHYKTVEYIGKLAEINRQIYNRQLANFYSDHNLHVQQALRLALAELEVRKDVYGYDAAAWAHYRNGDFEEAHALMAKAMVLGTRDARLYYHAGMIEHALGNDQEALRLLEEALTINPRFSIRDAEEARRMLESLK